MAPAKTKSSIKGNERVDPEMAVFIKLDDISRLFKKELTAQRDVMVQMLNTNLLIQEHLQAIKQSNSATVQEIAKWRESWQDEGEYSYIEGTATITETKYILAVDFDKPLKQYMIVNDGSNTIKIGHLSTGSTIDEVNDQKFQAVYSDDQPLSIKYHPEFGKGIRKIVLKTESGTSSYRLWLLW